MLIRSITESADGLDTESASNLFDDVMNFAKYGFNKSHAAAYALIGYQTAWVRHRFPVEFYAALMSYCRRPEKRGMVKDDMTRHGVALLPPDVNRSRARFIPEMHAGHLAVRYGWCGIKGLPEDMGWLEEERSRGGPFVSLADFHARCRKRLNKDHFQLMAAMGAFASMVSVRARAAEALERLEANARRPGGGGAGLFGEEATPASETGEWSDLAEREFKAAGFYLSGHPLDSYMEVLAGQDTVLTRHQCRAAMRRKGEARLPGRMLCVLVRDVQMRSTKSGTQYMQVLVADRDEVFQVNCFQERAADPEEAREEMTEFREVLRQAKADGKPVILECDVSLSEDGERVWVNGNWAMPFEEFEGYMDVSGDTVVLRLVPPEGAADADHLAASLPKAEAVLSSARSEDPRRSLRVTLACGAARAEVPGRYAPRLARQLAVMGGIPGVTALQYEAAGTSTN